MPGDQSEMELHIIYVDFLFHGFVHSCGLALRCSLYGFGLYFNKLLIFFG